MVDILCLLFFLLVGFWVEGILLRQLCRLPTCLLCQHVSLPARIALVVGLYSLYSDLEGFHFLVHLCACTGVQVVLVTDFVVLLTERDQKFHLATLQDLKVGE